MATQIWDGNTNINGVAATTKDIMHGDVTLATALTNLSGVKSVDYAVWSKYTDKQKKECGLVKVINVPDPVVTIAECYEKVNQVENSVTELNDSVDSLKKSVSDGKTLVANAITAKGISTATDATFEAIANNVNNIATGMVGAVFLSFSWSNSAKYAGSTSMTWNLDFDISVCKTINLSIANGSSSRGSNTTSVYAKTPTGSWVGVGRSFTNNGYTQLRIAVSYTDATDTSNWGINSNGSCSISTT